MANIPDEGSIRFWNGKLCSETQLNHALSGLAAIVRANPVLAEQWPMWRTRTALGVLRVTGTLTLVLLVGVAIAWGLAVLRYGLAEVDLGYLAVAASFAGLSFPIGGMFALVQFFAYPEYRPIATVKDGVISVHTASGRLLVEANLQDCGWYHGWASECGLEPNRHVIIFNQPAIIIRFPKEPWLIGRSRLAVGLTEDYRAIWEAFLTLADIRKLPNKRSGSVTRKTEGHQG